MEHFDVVVIGAGSGNMVIDEQFAHLRVAIVEKGPFGGTCLNRGCIPSKMLIHAADLAEQAASGPRFGVHTGFQGVDWPALRDRVFARTDQNAADGRQGRADSDHITVYDGTARFIGPRQLAVDAGGRTVDICADRLVLATGSRPVIPEIPGLAEAHPYTSDTIMRLDRLPRRLAVIGGGDIGCELAHLFSSLGVEVVQLESTGRLLGNQDRDVSDLFTRLACERWEVRLGADLARVRREHGRVHLEFDDDGGAEVDELLVVTGRRPNSDLLDLDGTGIAIDDDGLIVVDEYQRTSAAGVWALGDASSHEPLKHVANQDARVVRHNLLHPDELVRSDHRHVPQAVFGSPQIASIGLRGQDSDPARHVVATSRYADTAFGWAYEAEADGWFCKLIAERGSGRLVGAHLIGPQAPSLIQPLVGLITDERPIAGFARSQYWIHPAPTEVVESALLALEEQLA